MRKEDSLLFKRMLEIHDQITRAEQLFKPQGIGCPIRQLYAVSMFRQHMIFLDQRGRRQPRLKLFGMFSSPLSMLLSYGLVPSPNC